MAKSKRFMSHSEKDARLKAKQSRTAERKQANVRQNEDRQDANKMFVQKNRITLLITKQTVVGKDKQGHRITKVVDKLEKPSQAIRRYYRERSKALDWVGVDPQQAHHKSRESARTKRLRAFAEAGPKANPKHKILETATVIDTAKAA